MGYRLDEIDRRILYYLVEDARNTSGPMIAEEVDVSPGTIRNRIDQMEAAGIIRGYHADIDYEECDRRLMTLFRCTTPVSEQTRLAKQVLEIRGIVNVRQLMAGHGNLEVKAVGTDTDDISRIAGQLTNLGVEIEDEHLIQDEFFHPYHEFGPEQGSELGSVTDLMSLTGGAEVVEIRVGEDAPVVDTTLAEATREGFIGEEELVVAIEREDSIITPKGWTSVRAGDLVTVLSPDGSTDELTEAFSGEIEVKRSK